MLLVGAQMPWRCNEELFAEQMPDPSVSHYLAAVKLDNRTACRHPSVPLAARSSRAKAPCAHWQLLVLIL